MHLHHHVTVKVMNKEKTTFASDDILTRRRLACYSKNKRWRLAYNLLQTHFL